MHQECHSTLQLVRVLLQHADRGEDIQQRHVCCWMSTTDPFMIQQTHQYKLLCTLLSIAAIKALSWHFLGTDTFIVIDECHYVAKNDGCPQISEEPICKCSQMDGGDARCHDIYPAWCRFAAVDRISRHYQSLVETDILRFLTGVPGAPAVPLAPGAPGMPMPGGPASPGGPGMGPAAFTAVQQQVNKLFSGSTSDLPACWGVESVSCASRSESCAGRDWHRQLHLTGQRLWTTGIHQAQQRIRPADAQ
jgi:hypothetical protein